MQHKPGSETGCKLLLMLRGTGDAWQMHHPIKQQHADDTDLLQLPILQRQRKYVDAHEQASERNKKEQQQQASERNKKEQRQQASERNKKEQQQRQI
jgi:hypothetical protein